MYSTFSRPKRNKRLGQVFLQSRRAMHTIVSFLRLTGEEVMLEVGAGDGRLSRLIAPRVRKLYANELDERLLDELTKNLERHDNSAVIPGDILSREVLASALEDLPGCRLSVYGSIPYYITSPILRWAVENFEAIETATFLVQREVAARAAAKPGSRQYGFLSVILQRRAGVELGPQIRRGAFRPVPKVDSQLLRLRPRRSLDPAKESEIEKLAAGLFRFRRKQIKNSLYEFLGAPPTEELALALRAHGIAVQDRPERISPADFETIFDVVENYRKRGGKD